MNVDMDSTFSSVVSPGCSHLGRDFLLQVSQIWNPLETCPEVHFLGDSKYLQADNISRSTQAQGCGLKRQMNKWRMKNLDPCEEHWCFWHNQLDNPEIEATWPWQAQHTSFPDFRI